MNYVDKLKDIKNKLLKFKNNLDFVPRQTLSVKIDDKQYYVSLICNNSFEVKLILLDEFDNVIENIFEFESDKVNMVKGNGKLYLFTEGKCYIFDINNLKSKPEKIYLGNLNIQSVCSNQISYRYFINDIVSVHYDSDIDKLIINIAGTDSKGNLKDRIIKLSNDEIKRGFIKIDNFEYNNEKLDIYLK